MVECLLASAWSHRLRYTYIHTMHNAVLLVWGSLRLVQITIIRLNKYTGPSGNDDYIIIKLIEYRCESHQTVYLYGPLADLIFSHTGICDCDDGGSIFLVVMVSCGCVVTPVFMTGVALLGWSSFEFDAVQGNG